MSAQWALRKHVCRTLTKFKARACAVESTVYSVPGVTTAERTQTFHGGLEDSCLCPMTLN